MNFRRNKPPEWIRKFLGFVLDPRVLEAVLGDLEEKFRQNLKNNMPHWKASMLYVSEGLGFIRMARRGKHGTRQHRINLINHTFLFFLRLVRKDKSYYLVSLLALTLSLSSFMFIAIYVKDELAYDQFHSEKESIFRLTTHLRLNDVAYNMATSPFPAAEAIRSELSGVDRTVRIFPQDLLFELGNKKFEEHSIFVDESFFEVFSFPLVYGNAATALSQPASVVLTRIAAKKYFGIENPIGRDIILNGQTLTITGIAQDVPEQSHIRFGAIVPLTFQLNSWKRETGLEGRENKWFWIGAYTYVKLKNRVEAASVQSGLSTIVNKYFPERYKEHGKFEIQSLNDIHLYPGLTSEMEPGGSILYVRLFSVVAILIMVVSAINVINLSWFKVSARVREVGIRKFLGQNSITVVAQLCMESALIGMMAFLLSAGVCVIFIDGFNVLVEKKLTLWSGSGIKILGLTMLLIVAICLCAVVRPAIHFSSRSSMYLLLQKYTGPRTARVRNILVGLQVCFSFVLLTFSLIVSSQIDLFKNKDLGFDKSNVVSVELNEDLYPHFETFKNELKRSRNIVDVAGGPVPGGEFSGWRFVPEGGSYEKPYLFPLAWCDYGYINTLKIKLIAGQTFDPNKSYDSLWPFIINKRAAIELGWLGDPLNKTIEVFAPGTTEIMAKGKVIGVVDDYNFGSLHNAVKPIVLTVTREFGSALIRISDRSSENAIADIHAAWKHLSDKTFAYEFLDRKLETLYANEKKLGSIMTFFTFIAFFLTCYGMFAMSSLMFSGKLKEVSIRKVFGAGHLHIITQLYSRYAAFNLIAIAIGVPIAIYVGNLWLQTFQYRIEMLPSFFIKASIGILCAGMLSVTYYLFRVAFSNPIRFLRRE